MYVFILRDDDAPATSRAIQPPIHAYVMALYGAMPDPEPHPPSGDENQPPDTEDELAQWLANLQMQRYLPAFTSAGLDLGVISCVYCIIPCN